MPAGLREPPVKFARAAGAGQASTYFTSSPTYDFHSDCDIVRLEMAHASFNHCAGSTFQTITELSALPEAIYLPLGLKAMLDTAA